MSVESEPAANTPCFLSWLGAKAKYGMALPDANPTASQMYCPRGVYLDEKVLVVSDSGNHRLLVWKLHNGLPESHSAADLVIGQPDFETEGPGLFHLPTGVTMVDGKLLVADAWHHRILGWNNLPEQGEPPDFIVGQSSMAEIEPNRGQTVSADTLYWPYGLAYIDERLYVADTGNRRVLYWQGLPLNGQPAEGVIGQPDFHSHEENRGAIGPKSFRWAHAIAGDRRRILIADAGNHRILGFHGHPRGDQEAVFLLGQSDFTSWEEYPYRPQSAQVLRFPYSLAMEGERLVVADTANNRVLLFDSLPETGLCPPASAVIGQPDFSANGENNWKEVNEGSLCWPYGVHTCGNILAIADSGNNRVMLWRI